LLTFSALADNAQTGTAADPAVHKGKVYLLPATLETTQWGVFNKGQSPVLTIPGHTLPESEGYKPQGRPRSTNGGNRAALRDLREGHIAQQGDRYCVVGDDQIA